MRTKPLSSLGSARACLPFLWGFAAAAALDYLIDIQTLFLPALAAIAVVAGAGVLAIGRTGR